MMRMGALLAAFWVSACNNFESGELTARAAHPPEGMNCSSCHSLSLKDSNHVFHLFETGDDWRVNGPITCLDCHANSIAHRPTEVRDTVYLDPDGTTRWSSLDFPVTPGAATFGDTIRAYAVDSVRSFTRELPVKNHPRPGPPPPDGLVEWLTGKSHLNDVVDVDFEPRVSNPARYQGVFATFNPEQETCSAVACHPSGEQPWRFANPAKGFAAQKF